MWWLPGTERDGSRQQSRKSARCCLCTDETMQLRLTLFFRSLEGGRKTREMAALTSFYLGFSELRPIFAVVPEPEAPPAEINKNAGILNHAALSPSTSREIAHRTNI